MSRFTRLVRLSAYAHAGTRAFAVRDIILGLAQLAALRRRTGARTLVRLGILAESVDLPAALIEQRRGAHASHPAVMNSLGAAGLLGGLFLSVALPAD